MNNLHPGSTVMSLIIIKISNWFFTFYFDRFRLILETTTEKHRMTASFRCFVTDQRLTILDYDETKSNGRYRAVINEDKIAVLQLQSVDTEETVSKLSLCSGVLESNVLQLLSSSSTTNYLLQFLIEKINDDIVYR